jgi:hypothetical protein
MEAKIVSHEEFIAAIPEELRNIPAVFHAPYGFKLVEVEGKKLWEPGTLEDWRAIMALSKGVNVRDFAEEPTRGCYNTGPQTCSNGPCGGNFGCESICQIGQIYCVCSCQG